MSGDERVSYSVHEGLALISAHLPDWTASYVGFTRSWRLESPNFDRDGVIIEGPTPEEAVERAHALMLQWSPKAPVGPRRRLREAEEAAGDEASSLPLETEGEVTPPAEPKRTTPTAPMSDFEVARIKGFHGEMCMNCTGLNTRRDGPCLKCYDCGSTTGCG